MCVPALHSMANCVHSRGPETGVQRKPSNSAPEPSVAVQAEGRAGWLVTFPQFKVCCFSHRVANQLQNEMMTMLQCGSRVLLAVTLIMVLVVCTFAMRLPHLRQQQLCALCSLPHNRQQCRCKGLSLCPLPSQWQTKSIMLQIIHSRQEAVTTSEQWHKCAVSCPKLYT